MVKYLLILFTIHYSLFIASCTQDAYDKGEGKYSLMRADFAEAYTSAQKQIDYVITDEGVRLSLTKTLTTKWASVPDTVYRSILYYNKVKGEKGADQAEPLSLIQVPCPKITPLSEMDREMKTDPVKFESAWMSKSGKYLNLSLYLMTGSVNDDKVTQKLAVIADTMMVNPDASRTYHLRLYHDQGGVPEYYSTQVYTSIAVKDIDADSVCFHINTYSGMVDKSFSLNR